ncbi:MAG: hypothetical protein RLZZ292_3840 [Bacteroidota bacterium]|jgi:hypothetical protein
MKKQFPQIGSLPAFIHALAVEAIPVSSFSKLLLKSFAVVLLFALNVSEAIAESRNEVYSDFSSARNATPMSVLGVKYYTKDQFDKLGEAAQHLYAISNQDDLVNNLKNDNKALESSVERLNIELQTLRTQIATMTPPKSAPPSVMPQPITSADTDTDGEAAKKKSKSLTDWLIDNALVLGLIICGGGYYIYQKKREQ